MLERAYGCLVGSAIGDAMGMPASFMSPDQIRRVYGRISDFLPPDQEQEAHGSLPKGSITDDTEESLIVADVLLEAGGFDRSLFIEKMRNWAIENDILASSVIGPSTRKFLEAIITGEYSSQKSMPGDTNGGAMRVAPVGISYHGNISGAIEAAIASAKPSHGSKPGLASSAAVAAAIALAVEGNYGLDEIIAAAIQGAETGELEGMDIASPSVVARIDLAMELVKKNRGKSLDEVCYQLYRYIGAGMKSYESVPFSLGVFYAANGEFKTGLISAINIGDDADTNGAIAGALCGAYSGAHNIPTAWIDKLHETNPIDFMTLAGGLLGATGHKHIQ